MDSGPLFGQKSVEITNEDTIKTLYERIELAGIAILTETLPKIASGDITPKPQDLSKQRIFPQRSPKDGYVDWSRPTREIYNFIRAQTDPYPGARSPLRDAVALFWESYQLDPSLDSEQCGLVIAKDERGLIIACGDGKGRILISNFSAEVEVQVGDLFESRPYILPFPMK